METGALPSIERYLEKLPEIQLRDLSDEDRNCNICMEPFTNDVDAEKPVSLRCGHVFGRSCLKEWASSLQVSKPTCPMCRAPLTPSSSDIHRWELCAVQMQQGPYTAACQNLRRGAETPTSSGGHGHAHCDSAVELVRLFFLVVLQIRAHHLRHSIPPSALLKQSAQAVADRMGRLYVLLKDYMKILRVTVPWDEHGPGVVAILEMDCEPTYEAAFGRLAQVERTVASLLTNEI